MSIKKPRAFVDIILPQIWGTSLKSLATGWPQLPTTTLPPKVTSGPLEVCYLGGLLEMYIPVVTEQTDFFILCTTA